jgi:glycosyltransferase involved in cell wall biosynthesis
MRPLSLLMINPGASYATMDVHTGYRDALRAQGHTVREYALDQRIDDAGLFYKAIYRRKKLGKPDPGLVLTKACADIIPQALYHDVDGVIIVSGMYFHPDTLVLLRRAGIPTALILTESPYDDEQQARIVPWADAVFTNERTSVPVLRRANPNTHYLPHAHDPARHQPGVQAGDALVPAHDVVFVGSLFEERIALLGAVDWSGIDLGLYGSHTLLPSRHRLRRHIAGGIVDNATAAALYRRAKVGLNLYRTSRGFGVGVEHIPHAESLSPRAVELAACGVFHLSESRAEVWETFGPHVPFFRDAAGLEDHLRRFLAWPEMRARLARELPARVEHLTFDRQAPQLVSTLRAAWQGASAIRSA